MSSTFHCPHLRNLFILLQERQRNISSPMVTCIFPQLRHITVLYGKSFLPRRLFSSLAFSFAFLLKKRSIRDTGSSAFSIFCNCYWRAAGVCRSPAALGAVFFHGQRVCYVFRAAASVAYEFKGVLFHLHEKQKDICFQKKKTGRFISSS